MTAKSSRRRRPVSTFVIAAALIAALSLPCSAFAQRPDLPAGDPARTWKEEDSKDGRWNEMEIGPFLASVLRTPKGAIAKGLSIKVGDELPPFALDDVHGQTVVSSELLAQGPVVLTVFRGVW